MNEIEARLDRLEAIVKVHGWHELDCPEGERQRRFEYTRSGRDFYPVPCNCWLVKVDQ